MISIIEDTRQKTDKHQAKHEYWSENGVNVIRSALPFGDYVLAPKIAIDTKQDITEIGVNMCGAAREKKRFAEECKKAKESGCKLIFLIEDARFDVIDDLYGKQIYLHNGQVIPGDQLATAMHTMSGRYGCEFMFCNPRESARVIMELFTWAKGTF